MRLKNSLPLILLLALATNAAAETNKCTDAKGKISYINAPCPSGEKTQRVNDDNISVIDASTDRARQAEEKAKANANAPTNTPDTDILPSAPAANDANLAKLKQAQTLIQTAMDARDYLGFSAAIFLIAAAVFMLARRSRKPRIASISHEIAPSQKNTAAPPQNNPTPPRPPES